MRFSEFAGEEPVRKAWKGPRGYSWPEGEGRALECVLPALSLAPQGITPEVFYPDVPA